MGLDAMIFVFWILSFKPTFSLSSFTFIKRLFSSSLLSAIRVVSSPYLRLLIFLLAVLIPACASSSPSFLVMYSAWKLNKQGDNIQPWRTPFLVCNLKSYHVYLFFWVRKCLYDHYLELYWVDCVSPLHLVLFLRFFLFLWSMFLCSFCAVRCVG